MDDNLTVNKWRNSRTTKCAIVNGENWSWRRIRQFVWERDKGICQVCGDTIEIEYYECGHKIDRVNLGSDHPDNLAVMCVLCNRLKPLHETIEDYIEWAESINSPYDLLIGFKDEPVYLAA